MWGTGRVQAFANTGFPVDFIYPKEGAATLLGLGLSGRQGQRLSRWRTSSSRRCSSPTMQLVLLKDYGNGPVNKKVDVMPPELGRWRRSASARPSSDQSATGTRINAKREEWTKRWNREVER